MSKFTNSALDWLLLILEERFGHTFLLDQSPLGLKLSLANMSQGCILFPKLEEAFHLSDSNFPCSQWDADRAGWISVLGMPLPAPCVSEVPEPLIEQKENYFVINYDVLGLTYWMLNRIEEIGRTDLDNHDRFPATASHAYKNGYLERPIVDEWLHILGQVIQRTWPTLELKRHHFSMKVSHDVDRPSRYGFRKPFSLAKGIANDFFIKKDFKSFYNCILTRVKISKYIDTRDPANNFSWIMDQSEKSNIKSTFYFISGLTCKVRDADYDINHPAIINLIKEIHNRGHKIGLHPSYCTYNDFHQLKIEADNLRSVLDKNNIKQTDLGSRMHYLRWKHPVTLLNCEAAQLAYDTSLGYADRPGFRCGTCYDYQAFDPLSQTILKIKIQPLISMEGTIIDPRYLGLGTGIEAFSKFKILKERCQAVGGCYTLLWHNTELIEHEKREIYKKLIL